MLKTPFLLVFATISMMAGTWLAFVDTFTLAHNSLYARKSYLANAAEVNSGMQNASHTLAAVHCECGNSSFEKELPVIGSIFVSKIDYFAFRVVIYSLLTAFAFWVVRALTISLFHASRIRFASRRWIKVKER